jgi:hypothetical protein
VDKQQLSTEGIRECGDWNVLWFEHEYGRVGGEARRRGGWDIGKDSLDSGTPSCDLVTVFGLQTQESCLSFCLSKS